MAERRQGETSERGLLYEELADTVAEMITGGTYRPGERIPSIRGLSRQMRLSINTVMRAYVHLENLGMIEAVPQSGYYVRCRTLEPERLSANKRTTTDIRPYDVTLRDITFQVMRSLSDPLLVPLGRGIPNPDLLPADKLNRMLGTESRRFRLQSVSYAEAAGNRRLRTQIARRSLDAGCALSPTISLLPPGAGRRSRSPSILFAAPETRSRLNPLSTIVSCARSSGSGSGFSKSPQARRTGSTWTFSATP